MIYSLSERVKPWVQLLRVHHGVKNLFIFAAPAFAGKMFVWSLWPGILVALLCFSSVAAAVYAMNDAADYRSDRAHPRKCKRPIAAGKIAPFHAVVAAFFLAVFGVSIPFFTGFYDLIPVLFCYLLANIFYSGGLKNFPVVDLVIVSSGFLFRVLAGAAVTGITPSIWLICCTMLAAFFLAAAKRRSERAQGAVRNTGFFHQRAVLKAYPLWLLEVLCYLSLSAAWVAFVLYCIEVHNWLIALCAGVAAAAGLWRYNELTRPGGKRCASGENPEELLWRDVWLLVAIGAWAGVLAIAVYFHF